MTQEDFVSSLVEIGHTALEEQKCESRQILIRKILIKIRSFGPLP